MSQEPDVGTDRVDALLRSAHAEASHDEFCLVTLDDLTTVQTHLDDTTVSLAQPGTSNGRPATGVIRGSPAPARRRTRTRSSPRPSLRRARTAGKALTRWMTEVAKGPDAGPPERVEHATFDVWWAPKTVHDWFVQTVSATSASRAGWTVEVDGPFTHVGSQRHGVVLTCRTGRGPHTPVAVELVATITSHRGWRKVGRPAWDAACELMSHG